jgi:molybdate transport system substrate-binding protein
MTARTLKCILMVTLAMLFLGSIHLAVAAELHLFAGAGLRQPVDQLVKEYEASTGNKVYVDYGGSGQLLAKINAAGQGDLFMPGSLMYIEKLQQAGKVLSSREVVAHTPVIGVHRKSADRITTFEDLAKPGMRLAMGDPKAMALGRTALAILEKSGRKDAILKNVVVYGATVKQLALYVAQGSVDAAIIGRADAFQNPEQIAMVEIPPAFYQAETVAVAVLRSTTAPEPAQALSNFLSDEHAVAVFGQFGFLPLGGRDR